MSKFFNICLKLLTVLLCHQVLTLNAAKTRIVGGGPTTVNGYRGFIVSLRLYDGRFICGGSLVNKNYVVTAAHCVENLKPTDFNVHGGATYLNQVGVRRSVQERYVPSAYNRSTFHMDVAVVVLSSPMEGPNIATIPMCGHELFVGDDVEVFGWGNTYPNPNGLSKQLMGTNIRLTSTAECKVKQPNLPNTMVCASELGSKDACYGDAGGPLLHNGELCGIVSFDRGCGSQLYPSFYTNVNAVKDFIKKAILL